MGEFYHSSRAIPGDTFFTIVERDEEEGYIVSRAQTYGTKKSLQECVEWLKANGYHEGEDNTKTFFTVDQYKLSDLFYSYLDNTTPTEIIKISIAPTVDDRTEEEDWEYEHPLYVAAVEGLEGYDDEWYGDRDSDEYIKALNAYHIERSEYFKPYTDRLQAAIKGATDIKLTTKAGGLEVDKQLTFMKDRHYFTIKFSLEQASAESMFITVEATRIQPVKSVATNGITGALWTLPTANAIQNSHHEFYSKVSFDTVIANINNLVQGFITGIAIKNKELTHEEYKADQQAKARTPARPVKRKKNKKQRRKK